MTIQTVKTVSIYGITHAIVDAACIMVLYSGIIYNDLTLNLSFSLIVLYNIIAFGTQFIVGDIFDRLKKPKICAIIGCVLTALAAIFWKYPIASALLAGFGNSFFHVGGGIICLKFGKNKAAIPGMYVAPGAFGLFVGMLAAKNSWFHPIVFSVLLFTFAIIICFNNCIFDNSTDEKQVRYNKFLLILNFLLIAIAIRSYVGLSANLSWKSNLILATILTISIVFGKFFGGIIADRFGWIKVTVIALIISSPLISYGINSPVLYILGIFFFNFTMPVTLTAIANMLPNREGFAFGLTTLALIAGGLPTFYLTKNADNNGMLIFSIVLISAILIFWGLREYKNTNKINITKY